MERESFEAAEIAEILNRDFVAIKVDREERPDVDAVYMAACQAYTGQGGWPLTLLLTPDKKPFFAGTYFPPKNAYGSIGLNGLLQEAAHLWNSDKAGCIASGDALTHAIQDKKGASGHVSKELLLQAQRQYSLSFDPVNGGFGSAPKFPSPHQLMFLLRQAYFEKSRRPLEMAETTLRQMYRGGIFDHIGFGFSRYSTDEKWLAPHFEKMLYDNALLIIAYCEAYQMTENKLYHRAAERTIQYVLRDLSNPEGGFYSAQDADSDGEEGAFYLFDKKELYEVLGPQADAFIQAYGITEQGNFEGKNIPNQLQGAIRELPEEVLQTLYSYRKNRKPLHTDDKILTAWNALMAAALAKAAVALENTEYLRLAKETLSFLRRHLTDDDRLFIRFKDGKKAGMGILDDYAYLAWANLCVYQADYEADYLLCAVRLIKQMENLFWDQAGGGFFLTGNDAELLVARPKETFDGAMPSGNSVAGFVLQKLARLTEDSGIQALAQKQAEFLAAGIAEYPTGHAFGLMAFQLVLYPTREVVCVVKDQTEKAEAIRQLNQRFSPDVTALIKENEAFDQIAPYTKEYSLKDEKTTYYICQNHACQPPSHTLDGLNEIHPKS